MLNGVALILIRLRGPHYLSVQCLLLLCLLLLTSRRPTLLNLFEIQLALQIILLSLVLLLDLL